MSLLRTGFSQVCALHPKGLAPSKEGRQVGTPSYLEAQSEARGLGMKLGDGLAGAHYHVLGNH